MGKRDQKIGARSNDGAQVRDNNVGSPPYKLQPAGRQDSFREPILSGVTKQWEMNPYHLASFPGPAPLVGRLKSPLGAFDDRTERQTYEESEHLRHPRDLVYHQHIGFDNACEMTGHRLPVETSVTFRQREGTYVDDTYKEVPYGSVPLWTTPPTVIQIPL